MQVHGSRDGIHADPESAGFRCLDGGASTSGIENLSCGVLAGSEAESNLCCDLA